MPEQVTKLTGPGEIDWKVPLRGCIIPTSVPSKPGLNDCHFLRADSYYNPNRPCYHHRLLLHHNNLLTLASLRNPLQQGDVVSVIYATCRPETIILQTYLRTRPVFLLDSSSFARRVTKKPKTQELPTDEEGVNHIPDHMLLLRPTSRPRH